MSNFVLPLQILLGMVSLGLVGAVGFAAWNYLFGPRVIRLLINKYLRKRRIAWVSLIAVTLCTAMVIVVISVMGGWLRMFRESFHGLSGDIIISKQSMAGFPHYQEMIDQIEQIPEVASAVPVIQTFGLVNIANQIQYGVNVVGMPLEKMDKVSRFRESLYRQYQMADDPELLSGIRDGAKEARKLAKTIRTFNIPLKDLDQIVTDLAIFERASETSDQKWADLVPKSQEMLGRANNLLVTATDRRIAGEIRGLHDVMTRQAATVQQLALGQDLRKQPANFDKPLKDDHYKRLMPQAKNDVTKWQGMIVGVGVVGIRRTADEKGNMRTMGRDFLYEADVKLTVLGLKDEPGSISADQKNVRPYWIVDDSRTKIWQYDERTVYVPLDILQHDLQMSEYLPPGGAPEDKEPARVTDIQIGLKPNVNMYDVKPKIQAIVRKTLESHKLIYDMDRVKVQTWEEQQAKFLSAVEKEKVMLTVLFGIISIVAIFLIFCIFFMIVVEKTKDIGIIKSVGATSSGIAWIFLGYGVTIGVVGGGLGLLVGYLIIHNINEIHDWIGRAMGLRMWDPETYAFDTIPNTMNPREVAVIVAIAVMASLLGALVPAIRAARMHPIEALRWE